MYSFFPRLSEFLPGLDSCSLDSADAGVAVVRLRGVKGGPSAVSDATCGLLKKDSKED